MITLGDRIREARGSLTQDEFAVRVRASNPNLKISGVRLSRYERNVQSPRLPVLQAIASASNRPLDFFRVDDETVAEKAAPAGAEEEGDAGVMYRAASRLEESGDFALADDLRSRARKARVRSLKAQSREQVSA